MNIKEYAFIKLVQFHWKSRQRAQACTSRDQILPTVWSLSLSYQ